MSKESLKLTGRVVNVNAADQSFLIKSTHGHARLRVYADNTLFKGLDHALAASQFYGGKAREMTGTFYIQGRVLVQFFTGTDLHELTNILCAAYDELRARKKDFLAE
jgi:hypothetical protein